MEKTQSKQKDFIDNSLEAVIRIGLLVTMVYLCFDILKPFLLLIVWGVIFAVSLHPVHVWLRDKIGDRKNISATIITIGFLLFIIVPITLFSSEFIDSIYGFYESFELENGSFIVPQPDSSVLGIPIIGQKVFDIWLLAANNLTELLLPYKAQLASVGESVLSSVKGLAVGLVQTAFAIIISGLLLANDQSARDMVGKILSRLLGDKGDEFAKLAGLVISGVTKGIIGVSVFQSGLAYVGFTVMGIPGAGFWGLLCLILAIVQIGASPIIFGVAIYVLSTFDNTLIGILFLVWSIGLGLSDNILKPLLMGKGIDIPTAIIFLGAIGGFMSSGFIGLFTGAVTLVIGYLLFIAWLNKSFQTAVLSAE